MRAWKLLTLGCLICGSPIATVGTGRLGVCGHRRIAAVWRWPFDQRLKGGFRGSRRTRVGFESIRDRLKEIHPFWSPPTLRQIRYLRIWFEDPEAVGPAHEQLWTKNMQVHEFRFVMASAPPDSVR